MDSGRETRIAGSRQIAIESDWPTTVGALVLVVVVTLLLVTEIRHFIWGSFPHPAQKLRDFWGIPTSVYTVIAGLLALAMAFERREKSLKIAMAFFCTYFLASALLGWFHLPGRIFTVAVMTESLVLQIALAITLFEIAHWFRSVVKLVPTTSTGRGDI